MFSFFNKSVSGSSGVAYDYKFDSIDGGQIKLSDYKDRVIVIVNVASRCGYTPQYEDLQSLYNNYKDKNLVVIGVPTNNFKQEPGSNDQIKDFCKTNFGITFPMTEKINVIGANSHPFYKWAKDDFINLKKILKNRKIKIPKKFDDFKKLFNSDNFNRYNCLFLPFDAVIKALKL